MKKTKSIICALLVMSIVIGSAAASASAANAEPISMTVTVGKNSTGYMGIIPVTVTVENNSNKDIKNIAVSSMNSKDLAMFHPGFRNVIVTNPGFMPVFKKDAMTNVLKPGGVLKYRFSVVLSYKTAERKIPESYLTAMRMQHRLLNIENFRTFSVTSGNYSVRYGKLTFGEINTSLVVTAFYNMDDSDYDGILSAPAADNSTESDDFGFSEAYRRMLDEAYRETEEIIDNATKQTEETVDNAVKDTEEIVDNAVKELDDTAGRMIDAFTITF